MQIIQPGTPVYIKTHCEASASEMLVGHVLQVCLSTGGHISYKVRHWIGGEPRDNWFEQFELELPKNVSPVGIGFVPK